MSMCVKDANAVWKGLHWVFHTDVWRPTNELSAERVPSVTTIILYAYVHLMGHLYNASLARSSTVLADQRLHVKWEESACGDELRWEKDPKLLLFQYPWSVSWTVVTGEMYFFLIIMTWTGYYRIASCLQLFFIFI